MSICQQRWGRKEPFCKGIDIILTNEARLYFLLSSLIYISNACRNSWINSEQVTQIRSLLGVFDA